MSQVDGLFPLSDQPDETPIASGFPLDETAAAKRHLWVIGRSMEPCALEDCAFAKRNSGLARGLIKHTNLTGCDPAHCGGELWFLEADAIVINGNSGRYGPSDMEQLRRAGTALKGLGYRVATLGYDEELGEFVAAALGEEDVEWL